MAFESPPMPSLAPITPQGLPGGEAEALSSYVCGLALCHSVPTFAIASFISSGAGAVRRDLRPDIDLRTMNGYTEYARRYSANLALLGGSPSVTLCTCLPWSSWLCPSGHQLLHRHRLWCSDCFKTDRVEGRRPYQRLAWCLKPVTICRTHRRNLAETCPQCAAKQPHLPRLPFLDRCSDCGADLADEQPLHDEPTPAQLWDADCTHDLITATHRLGAAAVEPDPFRPFVREVVDRLSGGDLTKLGNATGLGRYCLYNWTSGRSKPSFLQAIRFFRSIRCPASALVTGYPLFVEIAMFERIEERPPRNVVKYPDDDVAATRQRVIELCDAALHGPMSLKEVARRLGRSVSLLRYRYPDLCTLIIKRAADHRSTEAATRHEDRERALREALECCVKQGIYPSDRHLRTRFGVTSSDLRRHALCKVIHDYRKRIRRGQSVAPTPDVGWPLERQTSQATDA